MAIKGNKRVLDTEASGGECLQLSHLNPLESPDGILILRGCSWEILSLYSRSWETGLEAIGEGGRGSKRSAQLANVANYKSRVLLDLNQILIRTELEKEQPLRFPTPSSLTNHLPIITLH